MSNNPNSTSNGGSLGDLISAAGGLAGTDDDWNFDYRENETAKPAKRIAFQLSSAMWMQLVLSVVTVAGLGFGLSQYTQASRYKQAESNEVKEEATELGMILPGLVATSALNFESPNTLRENSYELSMKYAEIPYRKGPNEHLSNSVRELIGIQGVLAEQTDLLGSIKKLEAILIATSQNKTNFGEFTRDVYIVTQMGKSFFELEYGIDQANYERTTHVMNAIIGCISALEQLNPERLRRLERETGLDFLAYRQKLVEFRSLKDYRVDAEELTGKLIDVDTSIVVEARLLATLAIAFHKFNLDDPIVGEATVYRDAIWRNLFGNFELLDGGVVAEFPEVTQKKSHAFICRALNDLAMGVKNSVDHDVKEVEAIYRRILKSTDQAGFYFRALTLSHRGDLYLSNQQILEINGDADQELLQQYQANELSDRESAINLLTKNFDEDTDAIGPRRILRKNYYRLGLAYFKQGDTDLALYHVGNGSFGPWQFIEKNGAVTKQLCEDVQLSAVEKFKVCAITLLTKHTYKDDFLKRRLDELVRQTAGSFAEYEERESRKSKEAGDRASRYVTYWLNDMMATMGEVKQDYDGDLLDGPLELVKQKLDERKDK